MTRVVAELVGVTKAFGEGETPVLRGIDLSVQAGEVVMLSGPSGSGKTTCLSILGCVLRATSGRVMVLGRDVTRLREGDLARTRLASVGFVFQTLNLLASLTAANNVAMLGRLRGMPKAQALQNARDLLRSVGLGSKFDSLPAELSGGERQRVAIARALIGRPPLILADEPTAALDAKNGLAISELLRSLAMERGHAVVVVTHDARIFHLADRRIEIEDGSILTEAA